MQNFKESFLRHDMNHVMSCHDSICHDNTVSNHDMNHSSAENSADDVNNSKLSKAEWYYLTRILDSWRVYNPRAVVKKNPQLAWRIMNLCKDPAVRVKGAYFTACFRAELAKIENADKIEQMKANARRMLGIA